LGLPGGSTGSARQASEGLAALSRRYTCAHPRRFTESLIQSQCIGKVSPFQQ
jgi:hypothetical protein